MTTITFLGGEECGNVAYAEWPMKGKTWVFPINQPVECDDTYIIGKARNNRFYHVDGNGRAVETPVMEVPDDPGEAEEDVFTPGALIAKADDMPFMAWKAKAAKILGGETPAKKDDILAALRARLK